MADAETDGQSDLGQQAKSEASHFLDCILEARESEINVACGGEFDRDSVGGVIVDVRG